MITKLRIDQRFMLKQDQEALRILQSRRNPDTRRAQITFSELTRLLDCGVMTTWRILKRLERAGHVKRLGNGGRGGLRLEVLTTQDEQRPA